MLKNNLLYSLTAAALFLSASTINAQQPDVMPMPMSTVVVPGAVEAVEIVAPPSPDYCMQDPLPVDCMVGGRYYAWWSQHEGHRHGGMHGGHRHGGMHGKGRLHSSGHHK